MWPLHKKPEGGFLPRARAISRLGLPHRRPMTFPAAGDQSPLARPVASDYTLLVRRVPAAEELGGRPGTRRGSGARGSKMRSYCGATPSMGSSSRRAWPGRRTSSSPCRGTLHRAPREPSSGRWLPWPTASSWSARPAAPAGSFRAWSPARLPRLRKTSARSSRAPGSGRPDPPPASIRAARRACSARSSGLRRRDGGSPRCG